MSYKKNTAPFSGSVPRNRSLIYLRIVLVLVCVFLFLYSRLAPRLSETILRGETMGTTYTVRIPRCLLGDDAEAKLQEIIDNLLDRINRSMSTYLPDSEISIFNRASSTQSVHMSEGFARVMQFSLQLAEQTQGAFDPTVEPLVNLWGFGPDGRRLSPPSPDEIAHMQKKVGYRQLSMPTIRTVIKQHPEVQLDFGAVAKGYAVDEVTHLLYRMDYQDMLVEIGGEVRAEGVNMEKNPWRIGIQKPHFGALPGQELEGIVSLSGWAMATSGDYQNFYEDKQGRVYAHIIDPRNGFPAGHSLASVTVICRNCMMADGLATALYVMGPQEGLAFINNWKDAEALFVERQQDGTFSHRMSTGFKDVTNFK